MLSIRMSGAASLAALATMIAGGAQAHGVVGNRFFPATLATDDPAVADELSLPTVTGLSSGDGARETDVAAEFSKRLTPSIGVSFEGAWTHLDDHGVGASGFQNLETTLKAQVFKSVPYEAILSLGVSAEWGGTGSDRVGAEKTTTLTPTVYFGKGAGDLPDSLSWARPLAVTGLVGYALPVSHTADAPRVLSYGVAVEYSLPYLASHVRDLGLPPLIDGLTPLVEAAFDTPVSNRGDEGTTGTINPGVIWAGRHFQLGAEAVVPINRASGRGVGFVVQLHLFLDDLFPGSLGRPLFGSRPQ